MIKIVALELTTQCNKNCSFCYVKKDGSYWKMDELLSFKNKLKKMGVECLSLGGGEPLLYEDLERIIDNDFYYTITTNGILFDKKIDILRKVNKVHFSIHNYNEIEEQVEKVVYLRKFTRAGVNFLVHPEPPPIDRVDMMIEKLGLENIYFLPLRLMGRDSFEKSKSNILSLIRRYGRLQSSYCLFSCKRSPRFISVSADKRIGFCSYGVRMRVSLEELNKLVLNEYMCLGEVR